MNNTGDSSPLFRKEGYSLILGSKIKQARLYRGLSQSELADKLGVTKQAISKYEVGKSQLSAEIIALLPKMLGFPISFFMQKNIQQYNMSQSIIYFRTKSISKRTKEHLATKIQILDENIMGFYKKYIDFPEVNIPDLNEYLGKNNCNYNREVIRNVARKVRERWQLGTQPITNLAYVLQSNGFILNKQYIDQDKTDGLSQWVNDTPYIFTSANKGSAVRSRFDNAHELGHLLLHRNVTAEEQGSTAIERDADYFASEFLYPSEEFLKELSEYPICLEAFISLKEKWGISIQAIVRKCLDLGLISDEKYIYFQKRISFKGWRKNEPLDDILPVEEPTLLKDATELLIDNEVLTKQEMLNEINMYSRDIVELCNLPVDFFNNSYSNIIKLYN